jgi:hypothetical protein
MPTRDPETDLATYEPGQGLHIGQDRGDYMAQGQGLASTL